jgi:hypothetical protein
MSFRDKPEKTPLDHAIDETFNAYDPESDDALKQLKLLKGLHALKAQEGRKLPSPDNVLLVAGNIVGILLIVGHEHTGVMASKAMSLVGLKSR